MFKSPMMLSHRCTGSMCSSFLGHSAEIILFRTVNCVMDWASLDASLEPLSYKNVQARREAGGAKISNELIEQQFKDLIQVHLGDWLQQVNGRRLDLNYNFTIQGICFRKASLLPGVIKFLNTFEWADRSLMHLAVRREYACRFMLHYFGISVIFLSAWLG